MKRSTSITTLINSNAALDAADLAATAGGMPFGRSSASRERDQRWDNWKEARRARDSESPRVQGAGHEARDYNYSAKYYKNSPYPTIKDMNGTSDRWRPSTW